MKTVLMVAYYFPPVAASGAMRPLGFVRYLERYGWRPRVLTVEPASHNSSLRLDDKVASRIPRNVLVDRVPDRNLAEWLVKLKGRLLVLAGLGRPSDLPKAGPSDNGQSGGTAIKPDLPASLRRTLVDMFFGFPDERRFWAKPAIRLATELRKTGTPDLVYATAPPWTSLVVGVSLAKEIGVPFVADFRDPWTDIQPCSPYSSPLLVRRAERLEETICSSAARIITTTEELRDRFRSKYPHIGEKCLTISNGFDSETDLPLEQIAGVADHLGSPGGDCVELWHFGTMYSNRNPARLFQAVYELNCDQQLSPTQMKIHLVGGWEIQGYQCLRLAENLEKLGFLIRQPRIPHRECLAAMAGAKALLVLQPDFPFSIPAKLYEYVAVGRPIVVIGGEGATASLVSRHGFGVCCRNEVPHIKKLITGLTAGTLVLQRPCRSEMDRFEYKTLTHKLAETFDDVCNVHKNGVVR